MEKKNIAGYISGLLTAGAGLFVGSQAGLILLEAIGAGTLLAAPMAIPVLAGALAVTGIGFRTMVNTFKGNRNVDRLNSLGNSAVKTGGSRETFMGDIKRNGQTISFDNQSGSKKKNSDLDLSR